MRTLGQLLGSAARTEVLRVLSHQPGAVGLRQTARIAGIHPHSTRGEAFPPRLAGGDGTRLTAW